MNDNQKKDTEYTAAICDAQRTVDRINELIGGDVVSVKVNERPDGADVSICIEDSVMNQYGATDSSNLLEILESKAK